MTIKIKLNHILAAITTALLALCVASVYGPIRFDNERKDREAAVKERLMAIRNAEETYRKQHGTYAASFKQLVESRLIGDTMQYVPYSGGKCFELATSIHTGKAGTPVPLMECRTTYEVYLSGLDEKRIEELIDKANGLGQYPGLKIGDITTPNDNAGNWE